MTTTANPSLTQRELDDIKTQFHAIMENYPKIYAQLKMTPDLPSAREARDKTDAALASLHNRMFVFKAAIEKNYSKHYLLPYRHTGILQLLLISQVKRIY